MHPIEFYYQGIQTNKFICQTNPNPSSTVMMKMVYSTIFLGPKNTNKEEVNISRILLIGGEKENKIQLIA